MSAAISRKGRKGGRGDLTASAAVVDVSQQLGQAWVTSITKTGTAKARSAWQWYDKIGEVHFAISRSARLAGHVTFEARKRVGKDLVDVDDQKVLALVDEIYSPYGGVRGLCSRFYTQRKVAASSHLVRMRDDDGDPDGWDFLSDSELDVSELETSTPKLYRKTARRSGSAAGVDIHRVEIRVDDYVGRVWEPHAQYIDEADSALVALADLCEQLHLLTATVKSKLKSRLATAGLLYLPSEIHFEVKGDGATKSDVIYDDDPLVNRLMNIMVRNMEQSGDAAAIVPIMLRGPGDQAEKVKWISLDREIFTIDMQLRQELIGRILTGLDSNQEAVKGVGESSNHWSAWAISDEERRVSIAPDMSTLAWALTRMVFQPLLADAGIADASSYVLIPNFAGLATKANLTNDMNEAWDRGLVSDDSVLATIPLDAAGRSSKAEKIRAIGRRMNNPYMALCGIAYPESDFDMEKAVASQEKPGPGESVVRDGKSTAGPGVGQPGSPSSSRSNTPKNKRPA